jgi:hypothetical protein
MQHQDLEDSERTPQGVAPSLDFGDPRVWIDKLAGNDPSAAERRTFLQRTRALREYLREQAERRAREAHGGADQP